jgi:lipoyl(octanoyl) transferase
MSVFALLEVCHDDVAQSAAMNMAIDEALLEDATTPSIRFYRWSSPALSFGYFVRFAEVGGYARERELVRRWTGGGIVFHGEDLTYSIIIPRSDLVFGESSMSIYEKIHGALGIAMAGNGQLVELATVTAVRDRRYSSVTAAVIDRGYSCFSNPVRADVMLDGHKIAGAAQRRTRAGLLHQGSIQGIDTGNGLSSKFAKQLSANCTMRHLPGVVRRRAEEIAVQRYGTEAWLRRR